ncbi:MAG: aminotransferase class V-fold PLP-dependent enzyme [Flavobacteriales bacterium]|nr:aminotransferase class V-fold PLP-dependent enzyme [Flavobacteriales bacterium]MBP7156537.1 aminotransferase class V-fold PLP-dependent enzyme [Flavobacteriales bacterium]
MSNESSFTKEPDWADVRKAHPAVLSSTYLNTPSAGAMAIGTVEAAINEQVLLLSEGASHFMQWMEHGRTEVLQAVAGNLGTVFENVALVPNFSKGSALLAPFLAHRPKVLVVNGDYPTLLAPFKYPPFKLVLVDPLPDGTIPLELLESAIENEMPDIVAISHVQWATGYAVDLKAVADLCRSYNALSFFDATQSWCCLPIDVTSMGIDVIGASGYKWPLAGFGNGFFYLAERVRAELEERSGRKLMPQLMAGHEDPVAFIRLKDALQRYRSLGPTAIVDRVDALCTLTTEALDAIGIPVLNGGKENGRSGFMIIEGGQERLESMQNAGVLAALRGSGIRIGLHFYNSPEDIHKLVEVLK